MKKNLMTFGVIFYSSFLFSQIGINTPNPQGAFHVDGSKDNSTTGSPTNTEQLNDFVVTNDGNIGIGTTTPTKKLEIHTGGSSSSPSKGFKLADGNENKGKILTSDADGTATWNFLFSGNPVIGTFSWPASTTMGNNGWNNIASIILPPGAYQLYFKVHILDPNAPGTTFVRSFVGEKNLGSNSTTIYDTPLLGSSTVMALVGRDIEVTQNTIYNNNTDHNVTLYFNLQTDDIRITRSVFEWANPSSVIGVNLIENYFIAIPMF